MEKKSTFFDFEGKGKQLKKLEKVSFLAFFGISKIWILVKKVGSLYIEDKS